jgi:hypothetical protein
MPKFSIACIAPDGNHLWHAVIEDENEDAALRVFFRRFCGSNYSNDDKGFHYFREDCFEDASSGTILRCD